MRLTPLICALASLMVASMAGAEPMTVPVPSADIAVGERIDTTTFATADIDSSKVYVSTVKNNVQLANMQAVRVLRAGEPINRLHVKQVVDVTQNTMVTIVYRKPGIELTGTAQALQDGRIGQSIRVLNPDSRATMTGVVIAANHVEIR